jgi:hypothetical protein
MSGEPLVLLRALQEIRTGSTDTLRKYSRWGEIADRAITEYLGIENAVAIIPGSAPTVTTGRNNVE